MTTTKRVLVEPLTDGSLVLRNPRPIGDGPTSMVHVFIERANEAPDAPLVAEKNSQGEWDILTYGMALAQCRSVAQWLLDRGGSIDRPLAVLSAASIQHFVMVWGAQLARVPVVPVSVSYSTVPGAFPKLGAVLDAVRPAFVFAEDFSAHQAGLDDIGFDRGAVALIGANAEGAEAATFADVAATAASEAVDQSVALIDHDTVTRYMFTSGSTGMPKGVIHTHGMACGQLASNAASNGFGFDLSAAPPRVLDWMPWSHVGAGVMRLNGVIQAGGVIYLDTGRPVPGQFDATIANMLDVKPTTYGGAPLGWSVLADALEADNELASTFFDNVTTMQFGSAAMPAALAERLGALHRRYTGNSLVLGTSLLSTEVSIGIIRDWPCDDLDVLGLPAPGAELKLVPAGGGRFELRVKSKGVAAGYLGDPERSAAAFDDDGYFCMGDAVRFLDPDDPDRGLVFAGRVSEDFKLQSGTWVNAGSLRSQVVAATSPLVRDVVVCGLNRDVVGLLVWPNEARCAELAGDESVFESEAVRHAIAAGLAKHNVANSSSSTRINRFILLSEPPDPGAYEITDKGYVNQAAVQNNRAHLVDQLFDADRHDGSVTTVD